jgi:hypothetical protein
MFVGDLATPMNVTYVCHFQAPMNVFRLKLSVSMNLNTSMNFHCSPVVIAGNKRLFKEILRNLNLHKNVLLTVIESTRYGSADNMGASSD